MRGGLASAWPKRRFAVGWGILYHNLPYSLSSYIYRFIPIGGPNIIIVIGLPRPISVLIFGGSHSRDVCTMRQQRAGGMRGVEVFVIL